MHIIRRLHNAWLHTLSGIYRNWGKTFFQKGDDDHAIQASSKAIHLNPSLVDAYVNRGMALTHRGNHGDYESAIRDFNTALEILPRQALTLAQRGLAFYYLRDFATALSDLNLAVYLSPTESMLYVYRGMVMAATNDLGGAISDYRIALRHNPNNVIAYRRRGDAHMRMGNLREALKDYMAYLEIGVMQSRTRRAEVIALVRRLTEQLQPQPSH